MHKTGGGHFVLPVTDSNITKDEIDVDEFEADAVMLAMFINCEENKDIWSLHDIVGHQVFVNMMLDEEEAAEVQKAHRYFGHRSGRQIWEMFAKAGKLREKKKSTLELLDNCEICRNLKKTPPRPRVGMPVANNFNEVVGLDLKVLPGGCYILWLVDMFTKAIKGKYLKNKKNRN